MKKIPTKYKKYLGSYGAQICDPYCGEEIAWGYRFLHHMDEEDFNKLRYGKKYGEVIYWGDNWFLILKWLTPAIAKRKFGKIKDEQRGPRGGFKQITYGKTTFMDNHLDPKK